MSGRHCVEAVYVPSLPRVTRRWVSRVAEEVVGECNGCAVTQEGSTELLRRWGDEAEYTRALRSGRTDGVGTCLAMA